MRRTILLLVGVLLSVVALGSDSPKEYDDKVQVEGIEGTWRLTEIEDTSSKRKSCHQEEVTFRGGIATTDRGNGNTSRCKYRIDPARKPPHLDWLTPTKSRTTFKFIYQIDGDTLRIAGAPGEIGAFDRRPQQFKDDGLYIMTYKRVK